MSDFYLGQIQAFGFGLVPKGWAQCAGQLLPVSQNQALFALLGTTFGGNGQTTFGLPNLMGQTPIGAGGSSPLGQIAGEASHTLTINEMPSHLHQLVASSATATNPPVSPVSGNFPAATPAPPGANFAPTSDTTLGPGSSPAGGSQPHSNMQPYLALNYCIALTGIFPPRS